jgi:putative membrane protein insertion efficiency factor
MRWLWRGPAVAVGAVMIALVRVYQWCVRPLLPPTCRFEPGCSEYMIQAVKKYGPVVGGAKGVWRICRCNPFCEGGLDPP